MKALMTVLFTFFGLAAGLAQGETLFKHATDAYNDGNFEKAIEHYNQILENGQHSAAVYFNLGNSYYKLGSIGPSIYNYEKALLLDPTDQEIKNNLWFAENLKLDAIDTIPKTAVGRLYQEVVLALSPDQWATLAIVAVFLMVLGYFLYYLLHSSFLKRAFFIFSAIALLTVVFAVLMAYLGTEHEKLNNPAIVFKREIVVNAEPNDKSERVFALHEGTKVNVLESLDDWSKISIADGQTGWVVSNSIKLIKDF